MSDQGDVRRGRNLDFRTSLGDYTIFVGSRGGEEASGGDLEFLEKATPDITVLKELAEFDANSDCHTFGHGDSTLRGTREDEALSVLIEVFDRVGFLIRHLAPPSILTYFGLRS